VKSRKLSTCLQLLGLRTALHGYKLAHASVGITGCYRATLYSVYAVVVCLSVRPSVRPSHAGIVSKKAKTTITQTTLHDSTAATQVNSDGEIRRGYPTGAPNAGEVV